MKKKRTLVSVYNKTGIVELVKRLTEDFNYEVISTGNTYNILKEAGIETTNIEKITGFPEILDGRIKTLHPKIHGGILADKKNTEHLNTLKQHDIKPLDLVVVNLYPFMEAASTKDCPVEHLIKHIDIGGPTLLRSAAKNYDYVTVICSPDDYNKLLDVMEKNKGKTTIELRQQLALKAFEHTSTYDSIIHQTLTNKFKPTESHDLFKLELYKVHNLRYGENPHQSASLYSYSKLSKNELPFEVLHGKELSYNNLVDITSALKILNEFNDIPTACIIKHNNPCGVATGKTGLEAYNKALNADPMSSFGGIVGINKPIDANIAELLSTIFLEVIISPHFTKEALSILTTKKNLRLIQVPLDTNITTDYVLKQVIGGILIQDTDTTVVTKEGFKAVTQKQPSEAELDDLLFAWKIAKHVSSNAIVVAKNGQTLGIGCGQTSRIGAMEIALKQACDEAKDAVIASDGFFPSIDNIHAAAQSRISAIIQPGGSIKDKDVIAAADKLGLSMIFTGVRHFKH